MDSIIITGAAGFIGSHLTEHFLKSGYHVIAVDNLSSGRRQNLDGLSGSLEFIKADVTQPWSSWLDQVAVKGELKKIFHFASLASPPLYQEKPLDTLWVNSMGLSHALQVATKAGAHVTFASTSEVYGDPDQHPQTEEYRGNVNTFGPRACYDEAKRFGEALIYSWNQIQKTNHGCVRIFNTYGPRMNPNDGRVVINFLKQAHLGRELTIFGDGRQTRSFCYVDDLVEAIVKYSERKIAIPVNIGNDKEFTINELAESVKGLFPESRSQVSFYQLPTDDPKQRRPDLTRARSLLEWQPKTPLKMGLQRMKDWILKEELV